MTYSVFDVVINTFESWPWTRLMARWFGEKIATTDNEGNSIVLAVYRGKTYLLEYERPSMEFLQAFRRYRRDWNLLPEYNAHVAHMAYLDAQKGP